MTLAVMTRATLGHTGRALKADAATAVIYLSVAASAAIRVAATALPEFSTALLCGPGPLWVLAFGLFVLRYRPLPLSPGPRPGRGAVAGLSRHGPVCPAHTDDRRGGPARLSTCHHLGAPHHSNKT